MLSQTNPTDADFQAALTHLDSSLANIQVRLDEGEVKLQGHVQSYFQKQLVQETIRRIDSQCRIKNELHVAR